MGAPSYESSSQRRRREKREAYERQTEAREAEEARVAGLSLWERIEEASSIEDIKQILHIFRERLELE